MAIDKLVKFSDLSYYHNKLKGYLGTNYASQDYVDNKHFVSYDASQGLTEEQKQHARQNIGVDSSGTVDTARKLATPRSLWGNLFDGTADVTGPLTVNNTSQSKFINTETSMPLLIDSYNTTGTQFGVKHSGNPRAAFGYDNDTDIAYMSRIVDPSTYTPTLGITSTGKLLFKNTIKQSNANARQVLLSPVLTTDNELIIFNINPTDSEPECIRIVDSSDNYVMTSIKTDHHTQSRSGSPISIYHDGLLFDFYDPTQAATRRVELGYSIRRIGASGGDGTTFLSGVDTIDASAFNVEETIKIDASVGGDYLQITNSNSDTAIINPSGNLHSEIDALFT